MLIPELAVNPLGTRIIEAFFTDERNGKSSIETINFRQFVRTLARFKKTPRAHEGGLNTRERKLDCKCHCTFHSSLNIVTIIILYRA